MVKRQVIVVLEDSEESTASEHYLELLTEELEKLLAASKLKVVGVKEGTEGENGKS